MNIKRIFSIIVIALCLCAAGVACSCDEDDGLVYLTETSGTFGTEYTAIAKSADDEKTITVSGKTYTADDGERYLTVELTVIRDEEPEEEEVYITYDWFKVKAGDSDPVAARDNMFSQFKLGAGAKNNITLYFLVPEYDGNYILQLKEPGTSDETVEIILSHRPADQ